MSTPGQSFYYCRVNKGLKQFDPSLERDVANAARAMLNNGSKEDTDRYAFTDKRGRRFIVILMAQEIAVTTDGRTPTVIYDSRWSVLKKCTEKKKLSQIYNVPLVVPGVSRATQTGE